jgi:hypothetical protein
MNDNRVGMWTEPTEAYFQIQALSCLIQYFNKCVTGTPIHMYSGRKITESLGNVTVRGEKDGKSKRGARLSTVCLSMYSITENIYCSQLSSVAILLQPEPKCFTSYNTREWLCSLSLCTIVLRSPFHVSTSNGQRSLQLFCVHHRKQSNFKLLAEGQQCLKYRYRLYQQFRTKDNTECPTSWAPYVNSYLAKYWNKENTGVRENLLKIMCSRSEVL